MYIKGLRDRHDTYLVLYLVLVYNAQFLHTYAVRDEIYKSSTRPLLPWKRDRRLQ